MYRYRYEDILHFMSVYYVSGTLLNTQQTLSLNPTISAGIGIIHPSHAWSRWRVRWTHISFILQLWPGLFPECHLNCSDKHCLPIVLYMENSSAPVSILGHSLPTSLVPTHCMLLSSLSLGSLLLGLLLCLQSDALRDYIHSGFNWYEGDS